MKIIEKNHDKVVLVEEMDESLANALRRSALEIPVLAIDEVEFVKNDGVLYDEVLALRLGLTPLLMQKDVTQKDKCTCKGKGCSKCSIQLKLVAKGPGVVHAKDLKGDAEAVFENTPLVILKDEQELEFIATAKLGKGIEHTKYSPGLVYYRNVADIEIDKNCLCEGIENSCPQNILKIEKDKLIVTDKYKCDLCEACVEECKKQGKECIKIKPSKEIMFFIESYGQMKAEEIFNGAIKALKENLKNF